MTRACGCSGDGCYESDVEAVHQRTRLESKRPADKGGCCQGKGDGFGAGGKVAKLSRGQPEGDGSLRDAELPCGCSSEGDCLREEEPPCGCAEEERLACGCRDEGDCLTEKLVCGCKSEGDCFRDEAPRKLACGCKSEGDCLREEAKKVTFDCGCKAEGDCFREEEAKKAPREDSCGCQSGKPCRRSEEPGKTTCCEMSGEQKAKCCRKKELACGCKSEGDCHHEEPGRLACGCKSDGDCYHEVAKPEPCSLACGCKSEGDCFHEVVKQLPGRLACGCTSEGDCFHGAGKSCGEDKKVERRGEILELSGPRTDEIYRTFNIPTRFMYPKLLKGYRDKAGSTPHPCYLATSTDYGWFSPTVHTVPTTYYPRDYAFSVERSRGGMYRNCSLNTELDKHFP